MSELHPVLTLRVLPEWLDYNRHMNDAAYALVFSRSVDAFMTGIGMGPEFRARTLLTLYTLTMTIHYRLEAKLDDPLDVVLQMLDVDAKKVHIWLEMHRGSESVATSEQLLVCVDQNLKPPRSAPLPAEVTVQLRALIAQQSHLPKPKMAGRGIAIRR